MSNLTLIKIVNNLLNQGKARREEEQLKKIRFLVRKTYDHYLYSQPIVVSGIDIPYFMYYKQRTEYAYKKTLEEMTKVIEECRVNKCFKKCVRQTKSK